MINTNTVSLIQKFVDENYIELSKDEEFDLRYNIKKYNLERDKEKLLKSILPYIYKMTMKYAYLPRVEADDLFSYGIEGALKAIKNDKINEEYRFVSWAWGYIMKEFIYYFDKDSRIIRLPYHHNQRDDKENSWKN